MDSFLSTVTHYKWLIIDVASMVGIVAYLKRYFGGGVCKSKARLDGKTVIITGANTGIGKETALDLAKRGARVIIACRDLNKANKAAEEIRQKSGNGNVVVKHLDLASLTSVKEFAEKINAEEERIDILINNAGVMACPHWKTKDGLEMQIGVNHFGHFYLTKILLDKIKSSSPSRIINVSSLAQEKGKINFDDLFFEKTPYDSWASYRQSKLCNVLFTRELAKRLNGTGVTCYSLHPGAVETELGRHIMDRLGRFFIVILIIFYPFKWLMLKSAEQGAQTSIYCAVDESLNNVSGRYYSDCKEKALLPHALNDEDAVRLWDTTEKIIGEIMKDK